MFPSAFAHRKGGSPSRRSRLKARRSAFTLIELLVVIAILAILFIVVLLVLNPAQLLAQARDADRVQDLATISSAINYYIEDSAAGGSATSLGSANTAYVSVSDSSATSTAGDQCQALSLASAAGTWSYHCTAAANYRNVNAVGWIPVNFSSISVGSPIGQLPVDPTEQTSSGLFYSYATNGSQYQLTARMESAKYLSLEDNSGGSDPTLYTQGTNLSIAPFVDGMIGWWTLNEGSGTTAYDSSGFGYNGTWHGTASGTAGTYYKSGNNQAYAGYFDGVTDYIATPALNIFNEHAFTVTGWMYPTVSKEDEGLFGACYSSTGADQCLHLAIRNGIPYMGFFSDDISGGATSLNTWYFLAFTYTGGAGGMRSIYLNGSLVASGASSAGLQVLNGTTSTIGSDVIEGDDQGSIDDVRVYDRALSAAEIAAMYTANK